jgi:hypothetical protein
MSRAGLLLSLEAIGLKPLAEGIELAANRPVHLALPARQASPSRKLRLRYR